MPTTTLTVTGMKCGGCEESVTEELSAVDGVTDVDADADADTVDVEYEDGADADAFDDAVERAGFEVAA